MIRLEELKSYLDNYLIFDKRIDVSKVDPFMTNGLMVKGKEEVKRIGFGVSASIELFRKANELRCDAIVVHHSFNLPPVNTYDHIFQNRISYLLKNEITLFGYHFLLDAHPQLGNNVQILKTIRVKPVSPYDHHGAPWGWLGEYPKGEDLPKIIDLLNPYISKRSIIYEFGPKKIKKVVAVSGKGAPISNDMTKLIDLSVDLYITGETHEWNRELFREARLNFIAGGHYNTEKFGIKALMEKVKKDFPQITVHWLDLVNEV